MGTRCAGPGHMGTRCVTARAMGTPVQDAGALARSGTRARPGPHGTGRLRSRCGLPDPRPGIPGPPVRRGTRGRPRHSPALPRLLRPILVPGRPGLSSDGGWAPDPPGRPEPGQWYPGRSEPGLPEPGLPGAGRQDSGRPEPGRGGSGPSGPGRPDPDPAGPDAGQWYSGRPEPGPERQWSEACGRWAPRRTGGWLPATPAGSDPGLEDAGPQDLGPLAAGPALRPALRTRPEASHPGQPRRTLTRTNTARKRSRHSRRGASTANPPQPGQSHACPGPGAWV